MTERIAIVSLAGRFPGAGSDLDQFWANIAAAADCSREVPPGRWLLPPERCTDPRVANPDTVYSTRGYYLDPFDPDLTDLDLDPALVALDPLFHLVLDVGNRAWRGTQPAPPTVLASASSSATSASRPNKSSDLCREVLGTKLGLPTKSTHPLNRYVAGLPAGLRRGARLRRRELR